nr:Ribose-phosphate pyrophosphokinase [Klebsiella pneumoniae]
MPVDNVFGSPILLEDMLQLNWTTRLWFLRTSAASCVPALSLNC